MLSAQVDESMLQSMMIKTEPALDALDDDDGGAGVGSARAPCHGSGLLLADAGAAPGAELEAPDTAPRAHRFPVPRPFLDGNFAPPHKPEAAAFGGPEFLSPSPLVGRRPTMMVREATELPAFLHLHQPMGAVAAVRHHQQLFSAAAQPMTDFSFAMPQSVRALCVIDRRFPCCDRGALFAHVCMFSGAQHAACVQVRHTPTAGRRAAGRVFSTAVAAAHMMQSPVQLLYHNPHHFGAGAATLSSTSPAAHRAAMQLQIDDDGGGNAYHHHHHHPPHHHHHAGLPARGWVPSATGGAVGPGGGGFLAAAGAGALPTLSFRGCDAPVPMMLATHAL